MIGTMTIDEKLWRLGDAMRRGRLDAWGFNFAKSVLGQAKRRGPSWHPTPRQSAVIDKVLAEARQPLGADREPPSLIDWTDTAELAREGELSEQA
jgi:hypothetical protein